MLQTGLAQLDALQGEKSPVIEQGISKKGCLVHWSEVLQKTITNFLSQIRVSF